MMIVCYTGHYVSDQNVTIDKLKFAANIVDYCFLSPLPLQDDGKWNGVAPVNKDAEVDSQEGAFVV